MADNYLHLVLTRVLAAVEPVGWLGWTGGLLGARNGMVVMVVQKVTSEMVKARWPWAPSLPWNWHCS